jgi:hypothetical protein
MPIAILKQSTKRWWCKGVLRVVFAAVLENATELAVVEVAGLVKGRIPQHVVDFVLRHALLAHRRKNVPQSANASSGQCTNGKVTWGMGEPNQQIK